MKKVALLTYHDTTNFGAMLQMYGLYRKINELGYECSVLNYTNEYIRQAEIPEPFRFSLNPHKLVAELLIKSKYRVKYRDMKSFFNHNIQNFTQPLSRKGLFEIGEQFDAYVAGSDMLWALDLTHNDYSYFLDFVSDKSVRLSFATSIGSEWTQEQLERIRVLMSKFKYVSVREEATANTLKQLLNRNCDVVCDPTMLLTRDDWESFVSKRYRNDKYVLVYFQSENKKNLKDACEYAKRNGLKVYDISAGILHDNNVKNVFPTKIEDFLSLLYYAEAIFTASYHGMLFGLYFHKRLVYYNRHPAYRMITAAKKLGVEYLEGSTLNISQGLPTVDYNAVDNKVEKYRKYSIDKLKEALQ